jgi:hypothetical protein
MSTDTRGRPSLSIVSLQHNSTSNRDRHWIHTSTKKRVEVAPPLLSLVQLLDGGKQRHHCGYWLYCTLSSKRRYVLVTRTC